MDTLLYDFLLNSSIFISLLVLAVSLYTLGKGADILVDSAVSLSLKWGVPKMILGATVISLGTTLPEASVSTLAAVQGNADLALGNAIGSVIADTGLIIGLAAMLGTVPVDKTLIRRQGVVQIAAAVLLAFVSLPFFSPGSEGRIYQWMGWIFVALLACYLYQSFRWAKDGNGTAESTADGGNSTGDGNTAGAENTATDGDIATAAAAEAREASAAQEDTENGSSPLASFLMLLAGIGIVVVSSKVLIPAVEVAAIKAGIPQSIIAATLVAFGTSVPELVTAITAVRKGHGELAAGNVIGADVLNVLFVLGVAAAVTPAGIVVPISFFYLQIPAMLLVLLLFRFCSTRKKGIITRSQGSMLFIIYAVYIVLNFSLKSIL